MPSSVNFIDSSGDESDVSLERDPDGKAELEHDSMGRRAGRRPAMSFGATTEKHVPSPLNLGGSANRQLGELGSRENKKELERVNSLKVGVSECTTPRLHGPGLLNHPLMQALAKEPSTRQLGHATSTWSMNDSYVGSLSQGTKTAAKALWRHKWRKHFKDLDGGELDALKRYLYVRCRVWTKVSMWMTCLSLMTWILSVEVEYEKLTLQHGFCLKYSDALDRDDTKFWAMIILALQVLTTLFTFALVWSVIRFHRMKFYLSLARKEQDASAIFLTTHRGLKCVMEVVMCAAHMPPGFNFCWYSSVVWSSDFQATYNAQMMNMIFVIRFFTIVRYITYQNRFSTQAAMLVLSLYRHKAGPVLALKDALASKGARMMFFCVFYFGSMFVLGYGVALFERTGGHEIYGSPYPPKYANCVWFIWTVVTTVGFGEWVPLTPLGRLVTVVAGLFGSTVGAVVVSVAWSVLDFSVDERKVVFTLDWMSHKAKVPHVAASVIQTWFRAIIRINKAKITGRKVPLRVLYLNSHAFAKSLTAWRLARLTHEKFKMQPTDPADIVPPIKELHHTTSTFRSEQQKFNKDIIDVLLLLAQQISQNSEELHKSQHLQREMLEKSDARGLHRRSKSKGVNSSSSDSDGDFVSNNGLRSLRAEMAGIRHVLADIKDLATRGNGLTSSNGNGNGDVMHNGLSNGSNRVRDVKDSDGSYGSGRGFADAREALMQVDPGTPTRDQILRPRGQWPPRHHHMETNALSSNPEVSPAHGSLAPDLITSLKHSAEVGAEQLPTHRSFIDDIKDGVTSRSEIPEGTATLSLVLGPGLANNGQSDSSAHTRSLRRGQGAEGGLDLLGPLDNF